MNLVKQTTALFLSLLVASSTAQSWSSEPNLPAPTAALASAVANDAGGTATIYVFTGLTGGSATSATRSYAPGTGWVSRAPVPTPRFQPAAATAPNGRIYLVGGRVGASPSGVVEEYDPVSDSWQPRASMPTPRYGLGLATGSNGLLYAFGGSTGAGNLATVEVYDPVLDFWSTAPSMPTARGSVTAVRACDDLIYVMGGSVGGTSSAANEVFDVMGGSWSTAPSLLVGRADHAAALGRDGKIYVLGGLVTGSFNSTASVHSFTPGGGWAVEPGMPTARSLLAASALGDRVYAVGGALQGGGGVSFRTEFESFGSLPQSAACLPCDCSTILAAGECDGFRPCAEKAVPRPALYQFIYDNSSSVAPLMFDEVPDELGVPANSWFGHTFTDLPANICSATLTITMRATTGPSGGLANNDAISLQFLGTSFAWGSRIENLPMVGCTYTAGSTVTFTLDLSNLPTGTCGSGTPVDLVPTLAGGTLDVFVQDDSGVDCIQLKLSHPCVPTDPGGEGPPGDPSTR